MENLERQAILERMRAIQARTVENGCTEAEAMAAAELLAKLSTKYNLTMTAVEIGEDHFWKIDYYDHALENGSENPADPEITRRVLTIMRADEY